jgi:AraC family transcriptional regulator, regulatory protein of adaptative response / methylated-DNA-[protein]-cysteine methyltransferase
MIQAVRTTKIFCRPSCSARPKPENVTTYPSPAAAERDGYRACKRCRPELGEELRYGVGHSPLGRTVVVAGEGGVRSVYFGDEEPSAVFPGSFLVRDRSLNPVARAVTDDPDVELDMRGTPFQLEVWRKLREIPRGETRTYTELAAELGRPRAVRAVARACATNRIGVLVPCHRVVGSDGSLTGYRWGIERKRALLEAEAAR